MSDNRVIIRHKDGREYSVTLGAHAKLYPDFKVVGEEEPASFAPVGIPKPKRTRTKPKAKDAAPVAAPVVETAPEPEA